MTHQSLRMSMPRHLTTKLAEVQPLLRLYPSARMSSHGLASSLALLHLSLVLLAHLLIRLVSPPQVFLLLITLLLLAPRQGTRADARSGSGLRR